MRIGTDISIATCRCEGYMVMDFKKRKLIKKGILDKDCVVDFTVSIPEYWNDAGKPMLPPRDTNNPRYFERMPVLYALDTCASWNDIMDIISDDKDRASVASCCDWSNCSPNFKNPTEYDLLNLASDVNCYFGIE